MGGNESKDSKKDNINNNYNTIDKEEKEITCSHISTDSSLGNIVKLFKKENDQKNIPVIGIDLGTTFSCVGTWRKSNVEIIASDLGPRIIPSIVCFKDKEILIGESAKSVMLKNQNSLISNSKRFIGKYFIDPNVQNDIKYIPVKIEEDPFTYKPNYCININENEEKRLSAEEVASMILKYLKQYSEDFIGEKVKKAVITVPAHFNNSQREATKEAAINAGLEVIRIINEPTAAAIAYGDIHGTEEERKVLIFDLGGGTFDVSIVIIKGNEFTVLASCGEEHLGGENFNELLVDYVINQFKEDNSEYKNVNFYDKNDKNAIKAHQKLRKYTEEVKKNLSSQKEINYDIDGFYDGIDLTIKVERIVYEDLCFNLWKKCFKSVDNALSIAKLKKEDIDDIILVGGSSRTPKIQQMIKEYFNGKEPLKTINPDEVVAYGATLVALIESINENQCSNKIKINEITSLSIGIEVSNGQMIIIIPKGTKLPPINNVVSKTQTFKFPSNKNKEIIVKIYEGEDKYTYNNHFLGKFIIDSKYNDGKSIVEIRMSIDHNSILKVSAFINGEKEVKNIEISKSEFYDEIEAKVNNEKLKFINEAKKKVENLYYHYSES